MRALKRAGAVVALFLAVFAVAMTIGLLVPRGGGAGPTPGEGDREIVVLANAIHTDIALPADADVLRRLAFLAKDGLPLKRPDVGHVLVGWGGRTFYTQTPTWSDLSARAVIASLVGDRSVLRLELIPTLPADMPGTRRLILDAAAFDALLDFLEASFSAGPDDTPQVLPGAGYGAFDRFYEAEGLFTVLAGCNTWTAAALRAAGVATGAWTPLPRALLWSLDLHARAG